MSDAKFMTRQYNVAGASYNITDKHQEMQDDYDEYLVEQERLEEEERRLHLEKTQKSLPKLYKYLVENGIYTKPFNNFTEQFYNEQSREKLHSYLQEQKAYTKGYEAFNEQFFSDDVEYYGDYSIDGSYTNNTIESDYSKSLAGIGHAIWGGAKQGYWRASSMDDIANVMEFNPEGITDEDISKFITAAEELEEMGGPSRVTKLWQKVYDEEMDKGTNGVVAWLRATEATGGVSYIAENFLASMGGMINFESAKAAVAGGATGAGGGFMVGGPKGAAVGGVAGAWGGVNAYNDALMSFKASLDEELQERGLPRNIENLRVLFRDEEFYDKARNQAVARGVAIGVIESVFTVAGGKGATAIIRSAPKTTVVRGSRIIPKASTIKASGVVGVSEVAGGMTGEAVGLKIQGKELDAGEIINEGVIGLGGAPVTGAVSLLSNVRKGEYSIDGKNVTPQQMQDIIDTATNEEVTAMDIVIKNDNELSQYVNKIQQETQLKASIDPRVTNKTDRDALFELERRALKFIGNDSSFAKSQLADIQSQIKDINSKYSRKGRKSKATLQNEADRSRVANAIKKRKAEEQARFAETGAKKLGLKTVAANTTKGLNKIIKDNKINLTKKQKSQLNLIGGFIDKGVIYINKEAAANTLQFNVGAHELLHGILNAKVKNQKALMNDIQRILPDNINAAIIKRMQDRGYERGKQHQEYLTVMSDMLNPNDKSAAAMEVKSLFKDKGIVDNIKQFIINILRRFGYKNIDFNKAEDVLKFMQEYTDSVKEGQISQALVDEIGPITAEQATLSEAQLSLNAVDSQLVNEIYREQGITDLSAFEMLNVLRPTAQGIARRYEQRPNYSEFADILVDEIQTGERGMLDVIRSYPEYVKKQQLKGKEPAPLSGYLNNAFSTKTGFKRYVEIADRILGKDEGSQFTTSIDDTTQQIADQPVETKKTKPVTKIDPRDIVKPKFKKAYNETVTLDNVDLENPSFKKIKGQGEAIMAEAVGIPVSKLKPANNFSKADLEKSSKFIFDSKTLFRKLMPKGAVLEAASDKLIGTSTGVQKSLLNAYYTKQDRADNLYPHALDKLNDTQFLEKAGIDPKTGKPIKGLSPRSAEAQVQKALLNMGDKLITNTIIKEQLKQIDASPNVIQDVAAGTQEIQLSKTSIDLANEFDLINTYPGVRENAAKSIDAGILASDFYFDGFYKYIYPVFEKNHPGLLTAGEAYNGINLRNYKPVLYYLREKFKSIKYSTGNYPKRDFAEFVGKTVKDIQKNKSKIPEYNKQASINFDAFWNNINEILVKNPEALGVVLQFLENAISSKTHPHRNGAEFMYYDQTNTGNVYLEHALQNKNAYVTLIRSIMNPDQNFQSTLAAVKKNYKLIGITYADNKSLDNSDLKNNMDLTGEWNVFDNNWFERYFNETMAALGFVGTENLINAETGKSFLEEFNINNEGLKISPQLQLSINEVNKNSKILEAKQQGRLKNKPEKGISVFDFDDTLAQTNSQVIVTMPDGSTNKINATEFALQSADLEAAGAVFDFSEFNKIIDGKKGPLFELALRRQDKFTSKDIFVLTARPQEAAYAIHAFLKGIGLEIPIENITGLEDGRPQAKADWIIDKAAEGYNNFYFADDAYKNVKAVQDVLNQIDVKSDVQQAKIQFSLGEGFNNILEQTKGIEAQKVFSDAAAKSRGRGADKFTFFLPPSAEDFVGLIYSFLGKGKQGETQLKFFEDNLIKPFTRGIQEINSAKEAYAKNYRELGKFYPQVKKLLSRKTAYNDFTYDAAIRVYLWDKLGYKIPGISKTDQKRLSEIVAADIDLKSYAEVLNNITGKKNFPEPSENWVIGTIVSDINDITQRVGRKKYLGDFIENKNEIFSKDNLNKIQATYGDNFRSALEDILYRMENGTNRQSGNNKLTNSFLNWVNNSVGAIMFFNFRSATLQTISLFNFINWSDNNPVKFGKAILNTKQYAKDFAMIFNSDMLKQRRRGLQTDVNEAEIAQAMSTSNNKPAAILRYLLQKGFIPTQMADSFAIASGGATFYRNRLNTYLKQGLNQKQAENKAFADFADASEKAQQSARPDMISQQQASPLGRLILAFQNTPMQYMRLTKKAFLDLKNGRGDWKTNVSKIAYYAAIQNLIFSTLSNAMFGMLFDDTEEDMWDKKKDRVVNNMMDTVLRGSGVYGAIVSTIKNMIMRFSYEAGKDRNPDYTYVLVEGLNLSPPVGSKARKLYNALQSYKFDADEMKEAGFSLDNPGLLAIGNVLSATANIPLDRAVMILNNLKEASNSENEAWQRIAMVLGWNTWDVGVDPYESKSQIRKKNTKRIQRVKKN
tara:strand:- start:370 stop:7308 length:6939 start_codon:yes stop_codon:yes gene_type:complete